MQIQKVNRSDAERIYVSVRNTDAATLTTGMGACYLGGVAAETASADGNSVAASTAARIFGFAGIAKRDIPSNAIGLCQIWGVADSVMLSFEADKTVGITGVTFLQPAALAGAFTSGLLAQNGSTMLYNYLYNLSTTNISGGVPQTKAFLRII